MTKEKARVILLSEIKDLYQIEINDLDVNLLSRKIGIPEVDFLYLFERLREKYKINIYSVIAENGCKVFTINNLAQKMIQ